MIWDSGPFYGVFRRHHWLYRLGFRWREQMRLVEGYVVGTSHLPDWAASRPGAGVVGTWAPVSRRFFWRFVPLTPWMKVSNQESKS